MIEKITMSNPNEFHAIECKKKNISLLFLVPQPNPIHVCTLHGPLILVHEFRNLFTKINMKCQVCIKIAQENNGRNQSTIKIYYSFCLNCVKLCSK